MILLTPHLKFLMYWLDIDYIDLSKSTCTTQSIKPRWKKKYKRVKSKVKISVYN